MLRLVLIFFVLAFTTAFGQTGSNNDEISNLLSRLKISKADRGRIQLFLDLGRQYLLRQGELDADLDSALLYTDKALSLSQNLRYEDAFQNALSLKGSVMVEKADTSAAKSILRMLKERPRGDLLYKMAAFYRYHPVHRNMDTAFKLSKELVTLALSLHDTALYFISQDNLAACYFSINDFVNGRNIMFKAIRLSKKIGNKEQETLIWDGLEKNMPERDSTWSDKLYYAEQVLFLHRALNKKDDEIEQLKRIADLHLRKGDLDISEKELLQVIGLKKARGAKDLHYTYDLLAVVCRYQGNYNKALLYALEAIKSMQITGDYTSAGFFYARVGNIYRELTQVSESIEWYLQAIREFRKTKDLNNIYILTQYTVSALIKSGKVEKAKALLSEIEKELPPQRLGERKNLLMSKGEIYTALKQFDIAEKYYVDMIALEKEQGIGNETSAYAYYVVGNFYVQQNRFETARKFLENAVAIKLGKATLSRIKDIHYLLFKVDSASGNYISAIRHFQKYKSSNDSIFTEAKSKQLEELQVRYETNKKEQDLKLLRNTSQLQQEELKRGNIIKNVVLGGIAMLSIILILLYNRYQIKQRNNVQLQSRQLEIDHKNKALEGLLLEKEWLLKEVHHRVKNNLQIIMSLLSSQSASLENEAALSAIRESQNRVYAMSLIHQKLYQSENIAKINMQNYIKEIVDYLSNSFNTNNYIQFVQDVDLIELDVSQAVPLGLIINEAITNAIKYAFPLRTRGIINISMDQSGEDIILIISDNGVGLKFNHDPSRTTSLGMTLIHGLSRQIKGDAFIRSFNGVTVQVSFPIFSSETLRGALVKKSSTEIVYE